MRELRLLDGAEPAVVLEGLREALAGGPAVVPLEPSGRALPALPGTVSQRIALVVRTSGSTGHSKAVALSADALLAGAAASESALGGPGQWLLALPAHYIAGVNVLVRSIAAELPPVMLQRFDVAAFIEGAERLEAGLRFTALVPAQLAAVLDDDRDRRRALSALRRFDRILLGGQSTPPALLERAAGAGLRVTRTYGSSETAGGCVYDGAPIGTTAIEIVDGQIELSGPVLAEGYLGDPARTDAAFVVRDGIRWYRTGDTGVLDDGVLAVTGRMDDVIISGGLKVSLGAVERVVNAMPGQGEAVVVAVPDDRWGEAPVVVTTAPLELSEVRAAVALAEGPQARPVRVLQLGQLPRLASGKPDRVALTTLAAGRR